MSDNRKMSAAQVPGFNMEHLLKQLGYLGGVKRQKPEDIPTGNLQFRKADSRTTSALQADRFSGIRANEMWLRFEIWVLGQIHVIPHTGQEAILTYHEFFLNPRRLNEMYCECFGLDQVSFDAQTQRHIKLLEERKSQLSEPEVQKTLERLADKPAKE
jgi:hypothetical protein